jgi:hypothetical protein
VSDWLAGGAMSERPKVKDERSTLEAAREFLRRGLAPIPIPRGEKGPRISGWPSLRLNEADLPTYFENGPNIGLILGEKSGNLVDVDLDADEALCVADFFLPQSAFVFGRASKPRSHRFFVCDPVHPPLKCSAPDGTTLIELRSTGQQTVTPPSIHPSGELYEFSADDEPARVDAQDLARRVRLVAAAALLARHWPVQGYRHDAALAVAGMCIRGGWSEGETALFIKAIATAAQDEEMRSRVRDVASTEKRIAAGKGAAGAPTLAGIIGADVVKRAREWLCLDEVHASVPADVNGWPEPAPLGDELLPVPAFDLELLPPSLRPLAEDIADRMQAPVDYVATGVIVALAGAVGRRAFIVPKLADTSWKVIPNLWGAVVAPPGMMKSPILSAVTLPLTKLEDEWRAEFESACGSFAVEKEQAELRFQAWREEYKQAIKKHESAPIPPETDLRAPAQKRLILTDATFEKLHAILAENPAGVLVIRDELTGWLSELGRLGREGERAFFLQAWNGDGGFTVDRIGRGSIHVPAVCVSLLGNIQPSRLRWYLGEAIGGGPGDDGLFQRFQFLVWPDPPQDWRLVDRTANDVALRTAEHVLHLLANLPSENPVALHFAPDAQELFFVWWGELENRIRNDSAGLAPAFISHLAKYRSLLPSLAGLFELADRAASDELSTDKVLISLAHTKQAAALCDFLESHARRAYASVISPETRAARELARHIQAGDLPSPFTTRAVYLKGWSGLNTPDRVRGALELLAEAGWTLRAETPPSTAGGRPSEVWIVSPKVGRRNAK